MPVRGMETNPDTTHSHLYFLSQLLPNLYHLKSAGSTGTCVGAIQDKLESMAGEIAAVMDDQLQVQNGCFYL